MTENIKNKKISDDNIFSELSKEIENLDNTSEKVMDWKYFIKLIAIIFWYLNLFFLIIIWAILFYNYIQNNNFTFKNKFIKKNCSIFLWKWVNLDNKCMSVVNWLKEYSSKIEKQKEEQLKKVINILPRLEKVNKLTYSENIAFLLKKSEDRLKPLEILTEFEKLRYNFLWTNKDQITCENIDIKDNVLQADCVAYSADFEENIPDYNLKWKISWTSATIAASFLNYIDKKSKKFKNIEKQKKFKIEKVNNLWFTKKTNFKIKLEYNPKINL